MCRSRCFSPTAYYCYCCTHLLSSHLYCCYYCWSRAAVDVATASDATLMEGIRMLAVEEGAYWATDAGHTFGVGKSTDDHLQVFLREVAPDHRFTSGQFLSGFKSRVVSCSHGLLRRHEDTGRDREILNLVKPSGFLDVSVCVSHAYVLSGRCKPTMISQRLRTRSSRARSFLR